MTRRMSCSMTIPAVRARTKTKTRRAPDTWTLDRLAPGDRLILIEKGMGLPRGARQVVIDEVTVVANTLGFLGDMLLDPNATADEGLPDITIPEFWRYWADGHGHAGTPDADLAGLACRVIEWEYDA